MERLNKQKAEAIERVKALLPPFVKLDESTYTSADRKARFIDSEYGEWWTLARNLRDGCKHPLRAKKEFNNGRLKPIEEIELKIQQSKPYLSIKRDTYINTKTECVFVDSEYGEFRAKPTYVMSGKTDHPIRGKQRLRNCRLIDVDVIEKRIQEKRPHISIKKDTYLEIKKPCVFIDSEYGEWTTTPDIVLSGCQHPKRANNSRSKIATHSSYDIELKVKAISPFISLKHETYKNTHTNAIWIDDQYGEWEASASNLLRGKCHPSRYSNISKGELELRQFVSANINTAVIFNDRHLVSELDIYISDKKIAIEYNGLFWHSEKKLGKNYHIDKRELCNKNQITLIQINEDEWKKQQPIVQSIIKSKLGLVDFKYQARKMTVQKVDNNTAQEFLKNNHLMGEFKSAKHIGLYDNQELVSLISYKKHKDGIDISRFCNKLNTSVAGGLSKLLKHIEQTEQPKFIQSWVDLRYGSGDSLLKIGFTHERTTLGWQWTDGFNTYNRLRCRANMDERKLSEKEHAAEMGWYRIYDAGQALFVKYYK